MLGSIRDRATGWIAGVIVGALIISFAFWGVSFYFGQGGDVNVAKVNEAEIDLQTFQRSFMNLRQQMKSIFGDELSLEEEELIRQQTLRKLIDTEIVNQIVKQNKFRVTDQQVFQTITNLELFQDEDGFDRRKYEQSIYALGMEPAFFEQQLKMDLLAEQLQAGLAETLFVTEVEKNNVLRLKAQTRDITYTVLNTENYLDEFTVSDGDAENYYEQNKESYKEPEKTKIAYLELDVQKLAEKVETTDEALRDYYSANKDTYDVAEQRSVTRLSVKTDEASTEDDIVAAEKVIKSALSMVNEGKDFEAIVKNFTDEDKGALEYSENAFITRGILDEALDEFLFNNDENAISEVIQTEKGFYIVKVGEIRGGPNNTFENVAEQVENDYKISQAELQYFELSDQLTTLAYEHPDTLEIAAEAIEQQVNETDYFSRNNSNEDITSNSRIVASSFNRELIDSAENSDAIELGENHIAVIRVIDYKPATVKPFTDVKEEIIADIKLEKAVEKLKESGEEIVAQLKSGVSVEELDTELSVEWNNAEGVKRDNPELTRSVLRAAFQLGRVESAPAVTGYKLGSGDYAIVMVTGTYDGDLEEIPEMTGKAAETDIKRLRGSTEWQEFLNNARNSASVTIFEENI